MVVQVRSSRRPGSVMPLSSRPVTSIDSVEPSSLTSGRPNWLRKVETPWLQGPPFTKLERSSGAAWATTRPWRDRWTDSAGKTYAGLDAWVAVFEHKRAQIVTARCTD
jgi:hypothetical protein